MLMNDFCSGDLPAFGLLDVCGDVLTVSDPHSWCLLIVLVLLLAWIFLLWCI